MISSRSNSFFIQSETDRSDLSSNISFRVLLSSTQTPSVQHKDHTFSALKIPPFNSKKPLSSTHPQFNTKNPSVQHSFFYVELRGVLNWGIFGVELRGFWCWTEGCVELMGFRSWIEGFWGLKRSGHFVLNWGRPDFSW